MTGALELSQVCFFWFPDARAPPIGGDGWQKYVARALPVKASGRVRAAQRVPDAFQIESASEGHHESSCTNPR